MAIEKSASTYKASGDAESEVDGFLISTDMDKTPMTGDLSQNSVGNKRESIEPAGRPRFPDFESQNESFPWQNLPETIRGVVIEICRNDKVAVPIAVQAVMSAVSLACQDLIWVDRGIGLKSVCSLYMLAVADTGSRKSRADSAVTSAIEDCDRKKRSDYSDQIEISLYQSKDRRRHIDKLEKDVRAWERQVRTLTVKNGAEDALQAARCELEKIKCEYEKLNLEDYEYNKPRLQRVLYSKIPIP